MNINNPLSDLILRYGWGLDNALKPSPNKSPSHVKDAQCFEMAFLRGSVVANALCCKPKSLGF
jgi:hypothetical protein